MLVALIVTMLLVIPQVVYAYIDPGTGSYLLQIIAVVIVSSLFALKTGWKQAVGLTKRVFKRRKNG